MKNILIFIFWVIGIFLSILLIVKLSGDNKKNVDKKHPKTENISQISNQQNTIINVGKTKTLYRFADYPNGKITKCLNSDAEWYPKGGKIKYKTSSGKILTDEPGTAHYNNPEPAGNFTFWADDKSAWGIEIWE